MFVKPKGDISFYPKTHLYQSLTNHVNSFFLRFKYLNVLAELQKFFRFITYFNHIEILRSRKFPNSIKGIKPYGISSKKPADLWHC